MFAEALIVADEIYYLRESHNCPRTFDTNFIFIQFVPDEDDGVEDDVGDGEVLGAVLHREGAGAAAEVVQPDAHLASWMGDFPEKLTSRKSRRYSSLTSVPKPVF